jgi:imidazolonepropionase-like amidohydrolase
MLAIRARQVFDGERLLAEGSVVLVDEGRIAGVQPGETSMPPEFDVAEFPQATLLPGLIDAHVHLCADSGVGALDRLPDFSDEEMTAVIENGLGAQLAAGVTTVRDLGDRRWAVIEWRDRNGRDAALPTVIGSGPPITSPKGHCWNMGGEAHGLTALRRAVQERADRGVDVVKIMASGGANTPGSDATRPQFSVEEIAAVVTEAHAAGLPVTAHAHALDAIRRALAAGVDALEHCTFITETGIDVDDTVVASLVESAIPVCPTLGFVPGAQPAPAVRELLRKVGSTKQSRPQIVARLHNAGVRLVAGSDAGISPGKPHGVLAESLIHLADGGVSTADVVASATTIAAAACGLTDRKGRLAPGLDADLLLLDGNPLADITTLRNVEAVYLRGRRVV